MVIWEIMLPLSFVLLITLLIRYHNVVESLLKSLALVMLYNFCMDFVVALNLF